MEYETIEIEIGQGSGRDYPVAVVRSPAGEAQTMMRFPFDELALENRLLNLQNALLRSGGTRRQIMSPEQETVQKFGQDLFNALMIDGIRSCYERSEDKAQREDKGLRIQLRVRSPEMATLPWEFMYDGRRATYLALSPRTPIVRYLQLPQSIYPLMVDPPLRILGMIANPQDVQQLDIYQEKQRVERAVNALRGSGLVELTWVEGETWRDLQRTMRAGRWHIFHFIGHGGFDPIADEGLVLLSDEQRQPHLLLATQLAELLTGDYAPRLVLLNACAGAQSSKQDIFSSTASILVRRGIPAVVAMQYEITDRAAIEFSRSFYESIVAGLPIETAIADARKAIWISLNNTLEWGTPVLYTHVPDGILFNIQRHHIDERKPVETAEARKAKELLPDESASVEPGKTQRDRVEAEPTQALQPPSSQPLMPTLSVLPLIRTVTEQSKLSFWLQWILANTLGWAAHLVAQWYIGGTVGEYMGLAAGLAVGGAGQWFILRRYVTQAHWWLVANALGLAVSLSASFAGGEDVSPGPRVIIGFTVLWVAQWFILRRYVTQAHWWLVANAVGLLASFASGQAVGPRIGLWDETRWSSAVGEAVLGAVMGAIYGAITGIALIWLLQHPISNQTAEQGANKHK